ncbi:cytochrome c family protein [Roseivivax sp. THAF30]|uniref:c-type cytochrome n=1 Tax=Roseivivax sp. THAF30 TaxID=2587852 RepID=UPI0012A8BCBA|nr:c-type cytochrome [Roseivivax sp. THAF30]QFT64341.1 Cytochrome c-552 [Roseivivax sp. THAF30]
MFKDMDNFDQGVFGAICVFGGALVLAAAWFALVVPDPQMADEGSRNAAVETASAEPDEMAQESGTEQEAAPEETETAAADEAGAPAEETETAASDEAGAPAEEIETAASDEAGATAEETETAASDEADAPAEETETAAADEADAPAQETETAAAEEPAASEGTDAAAADEGEAATEHTETADASSSDDAASEGEAEDTTEASSEGGASDGAWPEAQMAFLDGDAEAGSQTWNQCRACHVADQEQNRVGPHLVNSIGRDIASVEGYNYSSALQDLQGEQWTPEAMDAWLANPRDYAPGTKMSYPGLRDEADRRDLLAYLWSLQN